MVRKLKSSSLSDFSSKLVKFHKLPNGTELRLYRKNSGRRVRSDFIVKHKSISNYNLYELGDKYTVKDLFDGARDILSTDIDARGLKLQLYAPDGDRKNGNTHLGTVREIDPEISSDYDKVVDLFFTLLQNCDIEDITVKQAGYLYHQLDKLFDDSFPLGEALIKNKQGILNGSVL